MTPLPSPSWQSSPHHSLPSDVDWAALQPYFGSAPIPSIQTPSRSPPGMALLLPPKTISRSILKPKILSSTSLSKTKLLQLTQSSLIPQPLLVAPPWLNFTVAETPWSVMPSHQEHQAIHQHSH